MKTPRQWLLSRHQAAVPKLDSLRRQVVAEHVGAPAQTDAPASPGFLEELWLQLFWPCRQAWLGLAAAWMIVLVLHLTAPAKAPVSTAPSRPAPPAAQLRLALLERNRLRAELLTGSERASASEEEPAALQPRSDKPGSQTVA